jgi:hypothetical protein
MLRIAPERRQRNETSKVRQKPLVGQIAKNLSGRAAPGGGPIAARVRLCAGLAQPVVVLAIYKHGRYTEEVQATCRWY